MGLDPGFRTGVKVAVVEATGKIVDDDGDLSASSRSGAGTESRDAPAASRPPQGRADRDRQRTASREPISLVGDLLRNSPSGWRRKVVASEAGASVYSASALAAAGTARPRRDPTRGGSIARRLQDPLAELVEIEPKAIGVGQYQHDVSEAKLSRSLDGVVEDAVNAVGVDV